MKYEPLSGNHADEIKNENAAIHNIENNFKERKKGEYYILQELDVEWSIDQGVAESIIEQLNQQEIVDEETYRMIVDHQSMFGIELQEIQVALLDLQRKYGRG